MKKNYLLTSAIFTLLFFAYDAFSQVSATWSLTSNGNAAVSGALTAGQVSTGPGYKPGGISAKTYTSNGVSSTNWIGYSYLQFDITSQYYNKDYYQYTVSPASGTSFTVNNISFAASASATPVSWFAYYSLDGFATYSALGGVNATSHTGLNITVPEGSTFTLRIYGMDIVSSSTAFRNKNVVISGTSVSSCDPQTAHAGADLTIQQGGTTPELGGSVGGSATTGVWTSNAGGSFAPDASDLNATWTPPSEYSGTATLTLTTTNGCATQASATKTVTVNNDNVTVSGDLSVAGTATFNNDITLQEGKLRLNALKDTSLHRGGLLLIDENGEVVNGGSLQSRIYLEFPPLPPQIQCLQDINGNTLYTSPFWEANSDGMFLLRHQCMNEIRMGIGVKPTAKLQVLSPKTTATLPFLIEREENANQTYKLLQLNNNGQLFAREVIVDLDTWPDYVFHKEYKLMPLNEVETFIGKHGHLPNIPKAEVIENEGLNLGEMNKLLMQKVEELTLYLIEQQKVLEAQQKRIEALENKN